MEKEHSPLRFSPEITQSNDSCVSKTFSRPAHSTGGNLYALPTTHLREFRQVANVGNFEVGLHFELGTDISSNFDIWHIDVSQGLTRPRDSEARSEGNLCVNCSVVRQ